MELAKDQSIVIDEVSNRKIIVDNYLWEDSHHSIEEYFDKYVDGRYEALEAIRNRASIDSVIKFANAIRSAGGGNLIDSLMPSEPQNSNSCLIANALNFDCEVNGTNGMWHMEVEDGYLGKEIATKLNLDYHYDEECYAAVCQINLPKEIGYVAEAFDSFVDYELEQYNESYG